MTAVCPKHNKALQTWPSGDMYCSARDSSGPKGYCTYVLKKPAPMPYGVNDAPAPPSATPSLHSIPEDRSLALKMACLHFAGLVFQGTANPVDALDAARQAFREWGQE